MSKDGGKSKFKGKAKAANMDPVLFNKHTLRWNVISVVDDDYHQII